MRKSELSIMMKTWAEMLALVLAGTACVFVVQYVTGFRLVKWMVIALFFAPAAFAFILSLRSRSTAVLTGQIVELREFLMDPDAIIAPNFPEFRNEIIDWVRRFASRNGPESVYVEIQPDEPHVSDRLFLVGQNLSKKERDLLKRFRAELREYSARSIRKLPKELSSSGQVIEVEWD